MYKVILFLFFAIFTNASTKYEIVYKNIALGNINNIDTIKEGYLIAKPKNSWMKVILGFDKYILYQKDNKPIQDGEIRYKKDKYMILSIINELSLKRPKEKILEKNNQKLKISCKGLNCTYIRTNISKNEKYTGTISFTLNNKLNKICDKQSDICIQKK